MSQRRQNLLKRIPLLMLPVALLAVVATLSPNLEVAVAQPGTCVDDVTGRSNVCTANDVRIASVNNVVSLACIPGELVNLELRAEFVANANERYDIGLFVAEDGGDAYTGSCYKDYLPPPLARDGTCSTSGATCQKDADCPVGETCTGGYVPGEPFPLPDGGPFWDGEPGDASDVCGDLEQGVNTFYDLSPGTGITVPCIDTNGDGLLDIGTVSSWDNTSNNTCTGSDDAVPNTKSKCRAERVDVGNVYVAKFVEVVKALVPPDDGGLFDLQIDATTWFTDASHGDTTGPQEVFTPTATIGELAGTGTNLADYASSILCYDQVGRCSENPQIYCTNDEVCRLADPPAGVCEYPNPIVASCDPCTSLTLDIPNLQTNILCTITNTLRTGSITIVKDTDPPGAAQVFDFTSSTTPANFSLSDGENQPFPDLTPGLYTFTETVPLGWDLDRVECVGQEQSIVTPTTDGVDVELAPRENVVCTFYNLEQFGSITIVKDTDPPDSLQVFDFASTTSPLAFSLSDGESQPFPDLLPGLYTFTETVPLGWDLDRVECVGQVQSVVTPTTDGVDVELAPRENVVCTFYNVEQFGSITIVKDTDPPASLQVFDFASTTPPLAFSLSDGESQPFPDLLPGLYTFTETVPLGWDLDRVECVGQEQSIVTPATDGVQVELAPREDVVCTFYNLERPSSITIVKDTDPPDALQAFDFTSSTPPLAFSLVDGGSQPFPDLLPGLYTFTETVPLGWDLDRVECVGQELSIITPITDGVDIELEEAEDIVCTFYNVEQRGTIIVEKQTFPPSSPQAFDFTSDYGQPFQLSDGQTNNSGPLLAGTYAVTETVPPDWFLTSATCDDGSDPAAIDLQAGETVTCTFTNSQHAIAVDKTCSEDVFWCDDIDYEVTVTNTGGVTLTGVLVEDPIIGLEEIVDLAPGEVMTFTGTYNPCPPGEIIVEKLTDPAGSTEPFDFTSSWGPFTLSDGETNSSGPLPPGSYSVSESVPAGWYLTSATCDDGSDPAAIDLQPAEIVTCTFTNTRVYMVYLPLVMRGANPSLVLSPLSGRAPARASAFSAPETITNTVTATSLYLTSEVTATDSCSTNVHRPVVTKDANTSFVRTYKWTIDKSVDEPGPTLLYVGDFVDPEYTVVVDLDDPPFADTDMLVSGTITVANPAPMDAELLSVTDLVSPVYVPTVDCPTLTVPAGGSLVCTYGPLELPNTSSRTNTATATLINNNGGTTRFSGSVGFGFSQPATVIDEEVNVSDSMFGDFGTVRYDEVPQTFTDSTRIEAEGDVCELFEVDNESVFVTNDTGTTGSDLAVVQVFELCTLSLGYEDLPIEQDNDWDYNDLLYDVSPRLEASPEHDMLGLDLTIFQEPGAGPPANLTAYHHEAHLQLDANEFVCSGTYTMTTTIDSSTTTDTGTYNPGDDFTIIPDTDDPPDLVELEIVFDVPPVTGCPFELADFDFINNHHAEWLFFDPWLYVHNTGEEIHRGTETVVEPRILTVPIDWVWPVPDGNTVCNPYPQVTGCTPGPPVFTPFWWIN